MRLTVSLGLWLAAISAAVIGGHGWLQLYYEQKDLVVAAEHDLALSATAIRGAIESALRDGQQPDIAALLEQLELAEPSLDVLVTDREGAVMASSLPYPANAADFPPSFKMSPAQYRPLVARLPSGDFAAVAPLRIHGAPRGLVVLVRSANSLRLDFKAERDALVYSILILLATLSAAIALVIHFRLHRPLRRLVASIRRVAGGDLTARAGLVGEDEIAELGREFDAMAAALQTAARGLVAESEKRESLEVGLQRANKTILMGELAAMLAHEIGSPLQVLNGRARSLVKSAKLAPELKPSAEILVEQTERIAQIVQRLLDVARRRAPELQDVDVSQPVSAVLDLMSVQGKRAGVTFELCTEPTVTIRADAHQLQQVVLNLLQNALRASSRGATIRIGISPAEIASAAGAPARAAVAISVEDEGVGVPEEQREKIFEPFITQWDVTQSKLGIGLGLSVVRSIVSDHHGSMQVLTPDSGKGACFRVVLPADGLAQRQPPPRAL